MKRKLTPKEIELLTLYSVFLEHYGYLDSDWFNEEPKAIDRFTKIISKNPNLLI